MEPVPGSEPTAPVVPPRVSICSQILNQCEWAREMIQSVVDSTYENWELLIVDDGSTEDLKAVIESFKDKRIQYFRFDENKGIPAGVNFLFPMASGKYLCLLAADEVITKDKLAEQVAYLESHPGVDCVWGLPGSGSDGVPYRMGPRPEWEQYTLRAHNRSREAWLRTLVNLEGVPIGGASLMMKTSVMLELDGMAPHLRSFTDHELYCRFFEKYVGVVLPYRWAIDKPASNDSVRSKNLDNWKEEYDYVKRAHPLILPPTTGKVTVGIPCYNHAKYLPDAVASVLAQSHQVDEIMILNDGSTDDFKTVVLQFTDPRIKVMAFEENMGREEASTYMALKAQEGFFVSLSADDTLDRTYVEKCFAMFEKNPWLEFVASQTDFFEEDLKTPLAANHPFRTIPKVVQRTQDEWRATLYQGNYYFGAGMYRTKAIAEVGGWEKQYKVISDYQMYLKLVHRENIGIVEECLTHTRVTGKNDSLLDKKRAKELPWLYHAARKPFYRQMMKVIIATPFYEVKAYSPYVESLTQTIRLLTALGIDYRFLQLSGDSYVHRARNTMADVFLRDPDATDLFFIDSDMSWNAEAFVKMCVLPDDVVGGTYPVKNGWDRWTSVPKLYEVNGMNEFRGRTLDDGTALIEALVLAGGFLRIKRSVLERFRAHYKDLWYVEPTTDPDEPDHKYTAFFGAESINHVFFGEDHCFSKRLRDMGIRMMIYPNVDIVHWGTKDFCGNFDKFLKKEAQNQQQTAGSKAA